MQRSKIRRRSFLTTALGGLGLSGFLLGGERPRVKNPRATDGDERFEPDWEERLTITVGREKGDIVGGSDKAIQAAVDYVARFGGGTVHLLPGVYTLRNAIQLSSRIRLRGSGADSVITKILSTKVALADDSDWYDQEITLATTEGFRVGDGVVLRATDTEGRQETIKRTLVARSGKRFKLNDGLRKGLWLSGDPTCASLFPLLTSEYTADVTIENLTLDGNSKNNEHLDGNYAGCIFLQDCNRYTIRDVTTRNYNGVGISFQICHDVVVENCHSHDNEDLGMHPGSGSQRPLIRGNRLESNGIGLFWCWGVKHGLAENNRIDKSTTTGISIGHCDTDNVMRNNEIRDSGEVGILFRNDARGKDFWPNRNLIEKNRIVNSGGEDGVAVDIQGQTSDLRIVDNDIRELRAPMRRTGIRIAEKAARITIENNKIEGFAVTIADERKRTG